MGNGPKETKLTCPTAVNPKCPKAMIQWQHGSYTRHSNGSLLLVPFAPDGRQLMSDKCLSDHSIYTRFNTTELMKVRYQTQLATIPPSRSNSKPPQATM